MVFLEMKKYWLYILIFMVANVLVFEGANIISQPQETADLISPVVLVFGLIALASSFFAALLVTALLFSKTRDYIEQLNAIMVSVALFSVIIIILNFWVLFFFTEEQWQKGYLDATYSLPPDFEFNQKHCVNSCFCFLKNRLKNARLLHVSRKPVQHKTSFCILWHIGTDNLRNQPVINQFSGLHDWPCLFSKGRLFFHFITQKVAGRNVLIPKLFLNHFRHRAFPSAGRANQDNVHQNQQNQTATLF